MNFAAVMAELRMFDLPGGVAALLTAFVVVGVTANDVATVLPLGIAAGLVAFVAFKITALLAVADCNLRARLPSRKSADRPAGAGEASDVPVGAIVGTVLGGLIFVCVCAVVARQPDRYARFIDRPARWVFFGTALATALVAWRSSNPSALVRRKLSRDVKSRFCAFLVCIVLPIALGFMLWSAMNGATGSNVVRFAASCSDFVASIAPQKWRDKVAPYFVLSELVWFAVFTVAMMSAGYLWLRDRLHIGARWRNTSFTDDAKQQSSTTLEVASAAWRDTTAEPNQIHLVVAVSFKDDDPIAVTFTDLCDPVIFLCADGPSKVEARCCIGATRETTGRYGVTLSARKSSLKKGVPYRLVPQNKDAKVLWGVAAAPTISC